MSTKTIQTNKKGFTIIEVVLVLAIAGLIFLMVFVALPALQRNQRDTQRKNDMGRAVTAVTTFKSNEGSMPGNSTDSTALDSYLGEFKDPGTNEDYTIAVSTLSSSVTTGSGTAIGTVDIYKDAECSGKTAAFANKGEGYFAVVVKVENGDTICQDNS